MPGMLALGAEQGPQKERDMNLAENLVHTCYEMYSRQPTGIGTYLL